ncbi:hypothetical protein ACGFWD_25195 [Streptomyces sp. NPDC048448]|uniref:hypothetical protein n=1 Tax=Streptomyces sp. NPDC048448 TaxID=3365554 RepID=UPI0037110854
MPRSVAVFGGLPVVEERPAPAAGHGQVLVRDVTRPAPRRPTARRRRTAVPRPGRARGRCERGPSGEGTPRGERITTTVVEAAFASSRPGLRPGGKLVRVAVPAYRTIRAPLHGTVRDGITVTGSDPGTRHDAAEVLRPHAVDRTGAVHGTRPLASADEPADEVPRGRARTGIVLDPGTGR